MNDVLLLSEIGQALYGENWQSKLSADIAVSVRSMRRWVNGTDQIPWGVWFDVYRRLEARAHSHSIIGKINFMSASYSGNISSGRRKSSTRKHTGELRPTSH